MRLVFFSPSSLFPRRALWTVRSFSPARIWSQSTRPVRPQGGQGMSQVFNLFLHHHDGGSGASNYKDLRGGTRCAVTDSQFTDDSKSIFYFEAIKCKVVQSLNILLDALVKKG